MSADQQAGVLTPQPILRTPETPKPNRKQRDGMLVADASRVLKNYHKKGTK